MPDNGQHRSGDAQSEIPQEADDLAESILSGSGDAWLERVRTAEAETLGSIGSFTLLEEVGAGGQGVVYRAVDDRTGRCVALKHLHAGSFASPSAHHRFEREIEAAATLNHPGIVTLFSRERADGLTVISMEWIDGVPVTEWAASGVTGTPRRDARAVIALFVRICDAVAHAHQRGVIHRDLKPSNVLVDADGNPHVLDFGLAKMDAAAEIALVTRSGQFVGTPAYAAPEQITGAPCDVDTRSDVYALGVMLYEALTGRMPYEVGGPLVEVFSSIRTADPPRPSAVQDCLDREVDVIVLKTLRKEVPARYQSVAELGRELERYLNDEPIEARGNSIVYRLSKTIRRRRGLVAAALTAAVVGVGYGIVMPVLYRQATDEADKARQVQRFLEDTLTSVSPYQRDGASSLTHVLEEAAGRAERDLGDRPAVAADIHKTIARTYAGLWLWPQAEIHAAKAVRAYRALYGDRHAEVATCLNLLARAQAFQRDAQCVDTVAEAVAIRRALYGDAHPALAESLSTSGFARWNAFQMEDADTTEALYRSGMEMYEATLDTPTVRWARGQFSFGSFLSARGRHEEARGLLARSVEMYRGFRNRGERFYLGRVLVEYATCLLELDDLDGAEAALREALALHPQEYADDAISHLQWLLDEVARRRAGVRDIDETGGPGLREGYDQKLWMSPAQKDGGVPCADITQHRDTPP